MSRSSSLALLPLLGLATILGCSSETEAEKGEEPLALEAGCQPLLGGHDCHLPYPSDFFRIEDPSSPHGYRIEANGAGKLVNTAGLDADLLATRPFDGASRIPTIVGLLPDEVTAEGLPKLLDVADNSTNIASATLLLDTKTGKLVPHYADLDARAKEPDRQAIVIHPLVSLSPETRYVVAFQNVKREDGSLAKPAEGFRRLRDGIGGDPELSELASRWEGDVMTPLEALGVSRSSLQLAWDFTTTNGDLATNDMLRLRELTLEWLSENRPKVTIEDVTDEVSGEIWRQIQGELEGPLFLESKEPGSPLSRDASGEVKLNGVTSFPFTIQVPVSVHESAEVGRALAYSHGFFGSRGEAQGGLARVLANHVRAVSFAIDWWGMSRDDLASVIGSITAEPAHVAAFTDRLHQAMANWMTLSNAMMHVFHELPELKGPSGHAREGESLYDPGEVYLFGASQGHILGGTLAALDPNFSRIVLNVGGAGLSHMMLRSRPFSPFLGFIGMSFEDPLDQQKFTAMFQVPLDRIDPASYAPWVLDEPLPGSHPDRRVLMQIGLGDVQVPNLASFLHARLLGIGQLTPNSFPAFGLPQVEAPQSSAAAVFDYGVDLEEAYGTAIPAKRDNIVHDHLRNAEPALRQMDRFFEDGTIIHPCDGPCIFD